MKPRSKTAQRVADSLSSAIIPVAGKRPLLFDRFVTKALEAIGIAPQKDALDAVKQAVANKVTAELSEMERAIEAGAAEHAVDQITIRRLEGQLKAAHTKMERVPVFLAEKDAHDVRVWVAYGLTREEAAQIKGVPIHVIDQVCEQRSAIRIDPVKGRHAKPQSGKRALDV